MTAMLEMTEVSKTYGTGTAQVNALRQVNLSVPRGELVAVMGPSGSGKSSLLTIAGSLEDPTSGQVRVNGIDLSSMSRNSQAKLRRRLIGYVFQDFNLLAGFSAIENVTVPLELDGVPARAAHAAGMKALTELGVAERAGHFPDELSGGERQRVAIARAVVGDRQLLLCDEPTGALDSVNAEGVMLLLAAICRRGVAGVVVTHDAKLASCADRVVFLQDGQIIDQTKATAGPGPILTEGPRQ
jgi:putative ABC transport system ATP-binding protein